MKVSDVICRQLAANVEAPFTFSRGWRYAKRQTLIVEIYSDTGIDRAVLDKYRVG